MNDSRNKAADKRRSPTACCRSLESTPRTDRLMQDQLRDQGSLGPHNCPEWLVKHARELECDLNVSRAVNLDDCHTDTLCRDAARPVLGDWVDGDNWGVPTTADIVDRLVNMVILSDNDLGMLTPKPNREDHE